MFLAAELAPGDSGGALVDQAGNVVGVAFAVAPDRRSTAYALTDDEPRAVLLGPRDEVVRRRPVRTVILMVQASQPAGAAAAAT